MAFTTGAALVAALKNMTVTGIQASSKFAHPPTRVNAAQLPILYVRTPEITRPNATLGYEMGLKTATVQVVILVGAMSLDTAANNWAAAVTLQDALAAALESNAAALGMDGYSITHEEDTMGGETPYLALVADVEVSG